MTLAEFIINYRTSHGLSQRAFAKKCNVSNGYISMIEKEMNPKTGEPITPTIQMLGNIAGGMRMTLDELFTAVDDISIDLGIIKSPASEEARQVDELVELIRSLTPEEVTLVTSMIKGVLSNR